jgi:hypothetical protein
LPSLRAAFSREEQSDVAGSNLCHCERSEATSLQPRVAGRPQPTLCKHGGEAEPAALDYLQIASSLRSSQ